MYKKMCVFSTIMVILLSGYIFIPKYLNMVSSNAQEAFGKYYPKYVVNRYSIWHDVEIDDKKRLLFVIDESERMHVAVSTKKAFLGWQIDGFSGSFLLNSDTSFGAVNLTDIKPDVQIYYGITPSASIESLKVNGNEAIFLDDTFWYFIETGKKDQFSGIELVGFNSQGETVYSFPE